MLGSAVLPEASQLELENMRWQSSDGEESEAATRAEWLWPGTEISSPAVPPLSLASFSQQAPESAPHLQKTPSIVRMTFADGVLSVTVPHSFVSGMATAKTIGLVVLAVLVCAVIALARYSL